MVLKLLEELSDGEFGLALDDAGIKGNFSEAHCLIRLTHHLILNGDDPYTFRFELGDTSQEVEEEHVPLDAGNLEQETMSDSGPSENAGIAALRLAVRSSAWCSSDLVSESLTTIDASFAALLSSSLSPSPRDSASMPLMSTVPVVDVFGNQTSRPVAWSLQEGYVSCYYEYGGARSQYCLSSHLHQ